MFRFVVGLAIAALGTGCMPAQKYVTVTPYARAFDTQPAVDSIAVVLEDVPDNLVVAGAGVKKMEVAEFRRSFGNCLEMVLRKNFKTPQRSDRAQKQGAELVVHRVAGEWDKAATIESGNYTNYEVRMAFNWDATLYMDGQKVEGGEGRAVSQQSTSSIFNVTEVYSDGLRVLCEAINRNVFSEDAQRRLAEPVAKSGQGAGHASTSL